MRRAAKTDANQGDIVAALRGIGATVQPLHGVGSGLDEFGRRMDNNAYKGAGRRTCEHCGEIYHSYNKARKFCSLNCSIEHRGRRPERKCAHCGAMFWRKAMTTAKYCGRACTVAATTKPKKPKKPKTSKKSAQVDVKCAECGSMFTAYQRANRTYCSYECHLKSGGAQRAGDAAARAKMKYGAKKDANHKEVMQAIRTITAAHDLSNAGCGVPDGIAWIGDGWHLFDIKNPKTGYGKRGLNPRQKKWADDWRGGPVYLIYTVDEAIEFARGRFDDLKRFPDNV